MREGESFAPPEPPMQRCNWLPASQGATRGGRQVCVRCTYAGRRRRRLGRRRMWPSRRPRLGSERHLIGLEILLPCGLFGLHIGTGGWWIWTGYAILVGSWCWRALEYKRRSGRSPFRGLGSMTYHHLSFYTTSFRRFILLPFDTLFNLAFFILPSASLIRSL